MVDLICRSSQPQPSSSGLCLGARAAEAIAMISLLYCVAERKFSNEAGFFFVPSAVARQSGEAYVAQLQWEIRSTGDRRSGNPTCACEVPTFTEEKRQQTQAGLMDRNSSHGSPKEKERRDSKGERPSSPPSRLDALRAEDDDVRSPRALLQVSRNVCRGRKIRV